MADRSPINDQVALSLLSCSYPKHIFKCESEVKKPANYDDISTELDSILKTCQNKGEWRNLLRDFLKKCGQDLRVLESIKNIQDHKNPRVKVDLDETFESISYEKFSSGEKINSTFVNLDSKLTLWSITKNEKNQFFIRGFKLKNSKKLIEVPSTLICCVNSGGQTIVANKCVYELVGPMYTSSILCGYPNSKNIIYLDLFQYYFTEGISEQWRDLISIMHVICQCSEFEYVSSYGDDDYVFYNCHDRYVETTENAYCYDDSFLKSYSNRETSPSFTSTIDTNFKKPLNKPFMSNTTQNSLAELRKKYSQPFYNFNNNLQHKKSQSKPPMLSYSSKSTILNNSLDKENTYHDPLSRIDNRNEINQVPLTSNKMSQNNEFSKENNSGMTQKTETNCSNIPSSNKKHLIAKMSNFRNVSRKIKISIQNEGEQITEKLVPTCKRRLRSNSHSNQINGDVESNQHLPPCHTEENGNIRMLDCHVEMQNDLKLPKKYITRRVSESESHDITKCPLPVGNGNKNENTLKISKKKFGKGNRNSETTTHAIVNKDEEIPVGSMNSVNKNKKSQTNQPIKIKESSNINSRCDKGEVNLKDSCTEMCKKNSSSELPKRYITRRVSESKSHEVEVNQKEATLNFPKNETLKRSKISETNNSVLRKVDFIIPNESEEISVKPKIMANKHQPVKRNRSNQLRKNSNLNILPQEENKDELCGNEYPKAECPKSLRLSRNSETDLITKFISSSSSNGNSQKTVSDTADTPQSENPMDIFKIPTEAKNQKINKKRRRQNFDDMENHIIVGSDTVKRFKNSFSQESKMTTEMKRIERMEMDIYYRPFKSSYINKTRSGRISIPPLSPLSGLSFKMEGEQIFLNDGESDFLVFNNNQ